MRYEGWTFHVMTPEVRQSEHRDCARRWGYLNVPDFMTRSDLLLLTLGTRFRKQSKRDARHEMTQPLPVVANQLPWI